MFTHSRGADTRGCVEPGTQGPGLFEVKLIPQTMLVVIAPSLFFDTPPTLFFSPKEMRFGGCRWGAFNVIVCLFSLLSDPSQLNQRYRRLTTILDGLVHFSET